MVRTLSRSLRLRDLLLDAFAVEYELGVATLQVLDLSFQVVVLVDTLLEVSQEYRVAEKAAVLFEATVVQPQ